MSLGLLPEARKLLDSAAQRYTEARAGEAAAADIRTDLAELLFFEGKPAEAETQFRDLLTRERAGLGGRHNERETLLLNDLGASLRLQGKLDEAIATQREALAARESVHGAKSLPVAESLNNLASALFQKGQTPESIALFRRALSIRGELLRPDHPLIVRLQANLGLALTRAGQIDEAVTVLTAAAQAWDSAFGPDHAGRIATITSLSIALRKQGKPDEALQWLGRALDWQRAHQSQTAAQIAATEANMGIVLAEAGRDAEAEPLLTRAVPILGSGGAPVASVFKSAIEALAALYERTGRGDDARRLREQLPSTPPK
jgi:tetratricopeptide (TPR) repeat protein